MRAPAPTRQVEAMMLSSRCFCAVLFLGAANIPMTVLNDLQLDGFHLTFQALSVKDKIVVASNGLQRRFCK